MKLTICHHLTVDCSCLFGQDWNVTKEDIEGETKAIQGAARAVAHIRQTGRDEASGETVLFPRLPYILEEDHLMDGEERKALRGLKELGRQADAVISLGIGGSYLGNQVLFDIGCGEFWNLADRGSRNGAPQAFFAGQNEEPGRLMGLIHYLQEAAVRKNGDFHVVLLAISKSGTTIEPMSAFSVLDRELPSFCSKVTRIVITDKEKGRFHDMAKQGKWIQFSVPEGIGGRFSVFSQVGLVFASLLGLDIDAFLQGARMVEEACQGEDAIDNPALMMAALKYIAAKKYGLASEVVMPYGDNLFSFSRWYAQLLGESLGKKYDTQGREVLYGRTPVSAVGSTDMHSLTQEHQEGKRNKLLMFIAVEQAAEEAQISYGEGGSSGSVPMSLVLDAARRANAEALASDRRMSYTVSIEKADLFHMGSLMYFSFLTIAYEGALAGVNAYNQPGVEAYKKILHQYLREYAR